MRVNGGPAARAAVAVACLVAGGVLGGCSAAPGSGSDLPRAAVGDVVPALLGDQVQGRHSVVVVPTRRYDFTVSRPGTRIDGHSADEAGVSPEAGDDVRFVSLTWDLEAQQGDVFVLDAPPEASPELTLLADGEEIPVGSLDQEGLFGVHVAVPADAEDIGFAVEYDGLVQTVADAYDPVQARGDGPTSLYVDVPRFPWQRCPSSRLLGGDRRVHAAGADCTARTSSPLPYVGDVGWAPAGRAWVVVELSVDLPLMGFDAPGGWVGYEVEPTDVRVRLAGAGRPRLLPADPNDTDSEAGVQDDGTWAARAVFSVADTAGTPHVSFRRVVRARAEDPGEARTAGAPVTLHRVYRGSI